MTESDSSSDLSTPASPLSPFSKGDPILPLNHGGSACLWSSVPDDNELENLTVILCLKSSYSRLATYKDLAQTGVRIILVDEQVGWAKDVVWKFIKADVRNLENLCEIVEKEVKKGGYKVDGVLTFDEYGVLAASVLGEHLKMDTVCPTTQHNVKIINMKSKLRDHCEKLGLSSPKSWVFNPNEEQDIPKEFNLTYPIVCKPTPGAGSAFVELIKDEASLQKYLHETAFSLSNMDDNSYWSVISDVKILCEEYIEGQEVDIDCIIRKGEIIYAKISDNRPVSPPYFCETGGIAPSRLPEDAQGIIMDQLERFVQSFGVEMNTAMHYEAKYDPVKRQSYIIEANLRMGAAETDCLNKTVWGYNIARNYVLLACSKEPRRCPHETPLSYASSTNFRPPSRGLLTRLDIPLDVVHSPYFSGATMYFTPGDRIETPPVGFKALGWMVCTASTPGEAEDALEDLSRFYEVQIDDVCEG